MRNDQHALGRKLVKVGIAALILTCSSTQAMPNQQETKNNQLCSPSHIMSDGYDLKKIRVLPSEYLSAISSSASLFIKLSST